MKKPFSYILQHSCNKCYVVHLIIDYNLILDALYENDILFLDDCLYSLYSFLTNTIDILKLKNITCVISFSTNIYRHAGNPVEYADCALCHDKFHNGDMSVLQCYMSLDEIKELLAYDNIYLACHGANHLQLEKIEDKNMQMLMFIADVHEATNALKQYNLNTNIFVFPYAYSDFPFAYNILSRSKYYYVFAGKDTMRIQIEDLKTE